ncbi:hypothetical protein ACH3VR_08675 [Microbacterium sp. B2969]|uniref:4Fe-4S Wbl-type domain-containing protein n=1 Tax=Microbacterium alkaliflavum TaxID=3248839 RepID=A0ABW7Q6D4_9MICO
MTDFPTARWCRSRRDGAVCTRPAGHAGLHNRIGTSRMWSDLQADPPECPGSGSRAEAAAGLPDGFPHGRAVCPVCLDFVELSPGGELEQHDTFRGAAEREEAAHRAEWFNTFGWAR